MTKIVAIGDGTSNTLAFGESASGYYAGGGANFRMTWMGAGSMSTYYGLAPTTNLSPFQFSSRHSAGTNFAFCDGSVRTISSSVANTVVTTVTLPSGTVTIRLLDVLGGANDGQVYNLQ